MYLMPHQAASDRAFDADPSRERQAGCVYGGCGCIDDRTARKLRRLEELGEIGMDLAQILRQQAKASALIGTLSGTLFQGIARAVRMTTALNSKIEADSKMSLQQRVAAYERRLAAETSTRLQRRKGQVRRGLDDAIRAETTDADPQQRENPLRDLHERLDDPEIEDELADRTVSEVMHRVASDLHIKPKGAAWSDAQLETAIDSAVARPHGEAPVPPTGMQVARPGAVGAMAVVAFSDGPAESVAAERVGAERVGPGPVRAGPVGAGGPARVATGHDPPLRVT